MNEVEIPASSRLSVREITKDDIPRIVNYWLLSDADFLKGMGVDVAKLPKADQLSRMLTEQIETPLKSKRSYCIIWEMDGKPIGHCNTNPTRFGNDAFMHLHIWDAGQRLHGTGTMLVKMTLPYFFEKLQLKTLYSEPYALNQAPNRTLQKLGFRLEKTYTTVPGSLNFKQEVNRWVMTRGRWIKLK
jgi:ribosomal-protein-alanine N-acetyltransferase